MRVGAIVLAAGASTRMGQPKQLLRIQGSTLLQRAIRSAESVASLVVVVLGHEPDRIGSELLSSGRVPTTVVNEEARRNRIVDPAQHAGAARG